MLKRLEKIVLENLKSVQHFLVILSPQKKSKKLWISPDRDNGIAMEGCAKLNWKVGSTLEERQVLENAYRPNVCWSGLVDPFPLVGEKEYR